MYFLLEWFAVILSTLCSTIRAFNVGHQRMSYIGSILAYGILTWLMILEGRGSLIFSNVLTILLSVVGMMRYK